MSNGTQGDKRVAFGMLAVGVAICAFGVYSEQDNAARYAWPEVAGTITEAKIRTSVSGSAGNNCGIRLEYRYEVGGKSFEGTGSIGDPRDYDFDRVINASCRDMPELLEAVEKKGTVRVWYPPDAPEQGTTYRERHYWAYMFIVPGALLALLGLVAAFTDQNR